LNADPTELQKQKEMNNYNIIQLILEKPKNSHKANMLPKLSSDKIKFQIYNKKNVWVNINGIT